MVGCSRRHSRQNAKDGAASDGGSYNDEFGFSTKAQLQPVVGDVGMRRQILLERLRQLMRDVDEISFFGLNARCDFERLRDTQMSRVWLLPRSASMIKHSTPKIFCAISSGTALQSLR